MVNTIPVSKREVAAVRMATSLLSVPTPHQTPISTRLSLSNSAWLHLHSSATPIRNPYKSVILLCSSSSSVSVVQEDSSPPTDVAVSIESDPPAGVVDNVFISKGCKACGREEVERGCNGEGRIQGGIATVPGFGWWPIKAYRPCPGFVASGGRYRRRGQSMDEVAFGRKEREPLMSTSNDGEAQSSKKPGPKKVKR